MADIQLSESGLDFDLVISGGDLVADDGLRTAILLSLFCDARAHDDDGFLPGDRRGWWADEYLENEGDEIGSRLWLLQREKRTNETLLRAREYAREALQWLVDDGVATRVDVVAQFHGSALNLEIALLKPEGLERFSFSDVWNAEAAEGAAVKKTPRPVNEV